MFRDYKNVAKTCQACQRSVNKLETVGELFPQTASFPGEKCAINLVGPFPITTRGNQYVLTFIDSFTRWPEAFPIPDKKIETVAWVFINHIYKRCLVGNHLLSDQGSEFNDKLASDINRMLSIHHARTSAYHPQHNGLIEH